MIFYNIIAIVFPQTVRLILDNIVARRPLFKINGFYIDSTRAPKCGNPNCDGRNLKPHLFGKRRLVTNREDDDDEDADDADRRETINSKANGWWSIFDGWKSL